MRTAWRDEVRTWAPVDLVFIDETGTQTDMTPRTGRAPRGQRVVETLPRHRGGNTSLVAAMGVAGIQAAFTVEGAIARPACTLFVRDVLVPTRRPGQHMIWDNLSVHRGNEARRWIAQAGCTVHFLPASSPDLNPIELALSKCKTLLRRTGARTRGGLDAAISSAPPQLTAANAAAWITHCGYGPPCQAP